MSRYGYLLFLAMFASLPSMCPAKPAERFTYEKTVELTGTIERQSYTDSGPPYFGEGKLPYPPYSSAPDVQVLVFVPDEPLDVIATAKSGPEQDSYHNVDCLEIDILDAAAAQKHLGAHVRISGFLSERETGFDYTDVIITAQKITVLR
jgi:hypothetical protein